MSEPVQELLGLLSLARRAREAETPEALGFVMVNESLQLLQYRQAALWQGGALGQVKAVSGLPQPNPSAPYTQFLTRLFRALEQQPDAAGLRVANVPAELAEEAAEWLPAHLLCMPLRHGETPSRAMLLLAAEQPWQEHELAIARELAGAYAHALVAFAPREKPWRRWRELFAGRRRWFWGGALVIALFPVEQSVLAPAEVVPKDPFLVRAPLDGVIERMLVQPNQPVKAGTPLFSLDQTALQTRHALARKAYDTAQEEYRQSAQLAVTDDKSKLEIALRRGALEEKGVELAYTAEQLGRVQVAAERDGVAVFSDVNDWQGKVVALGERVLTLADPAKVELSVELPAGERFDAQPGTQVSLYPNASPLNSYEAVVTQVAYSAEMARSGQLAYRIKADLAPGETLPRIGTMGSARLHGSRLPLIVYALRRPLTTVRQWLGV